MVFHDVVEARKLARKLEWQASHDPLTELPNRREFERQTVALLGSEEERGSGCLLYLDLDQFKVINDTCGHAAGDRLLRELPSVLVEEVGEEHVVARLGGDEFGILLRGATVDKAVEVAQRLIAAIRSYRFVYDAEVYEIGVSIGLVEISDQSLGVLLSNADMACYAAKEQGRNRLHVYHMNDEEIARRHLEMEWVVRLNKGLQERSFLLFQQAIVPLEAHGATERHVEILLRMQGDEGLILPGEFLGAAERYNLTCELDRWVVDTALASYADRRTEFEGAEIVFSINLSGASLSDGRILPFVRDRLRYFGLSPTRFCIEVTETSAIANLGRIRRDMIELKKEGLRFALDDFGSGLSSYAYLKHLPVDYIKIDGSFVVDMFEEPMNRAIVESINYLGHSMNLQTIAEFVETAEVQELVLAMGVDYAQGFALHRPEPLEKLLSS